ncbi:alcohol dehydrogenase catalytic domain-containing protein [Pseudorhodoplanes sp.]|uniref:alcohol dehydrogenase catalytic domain-containing protein n=1 Tax=Pseudorhodoplanes sp. TaxID=1934341 RepID=UPI002CA8479E|nr:alcohol dehydrogenase catalytic domain-containing protein [Pseudorhodoplanes sp.]HWV55494.1 alcohol dehydrogenase catalytic domain-containing protein [Pseudorhodoplanes sp.]
MLALRKTQPGTGGLSLDEIAVPAAPGFGEVRIRVSATGICGTDLAIYNWLPFLRTMTLPVVLGHEISGVVDSVGPGVTRVKLGDLVSVESHIPCGHCYTCLRGFAHVCPHTRYPGIHINGGFARYTTLPEQILYVLDPSLSHEVAAMFEPFGVAVHAVMEGSGVSGLNVVIAGCGPIGLMAVKAARALGANRIIAADKNPMRLAQAKEFGADETIDVIERDARGSITHLTDGNGPDVFIDFSAAAESVQLATEVITAGGEIRLAAAPGDSISLDVEKWLHRGVTVRGLHGRRLFASWVHAMRLVRSGQVDLRPLISHVIPLQDAVRGFEEALDGRTLKVLIKPD